MDQPYLLLNSGPSHSFTLEEAGKHIGILRLVAWVEPAPYGHLEGMGEWTQAGIQVPLFFAPVERSRFVGLGLVHALYPLSEFLLTPSFLPFVLVILGPLSLAVQFWTRFLRPFFLPELECGIDGELLVLESP